MLASHPAIVSLPETHFFGKAVARGWRRRLGFASAEADAVLNGVLAHLGQVDLPPGVRLRPRSFASYAAAFREILDRAVRERGARAWLEKSPRHLHHVDLIRRHIPDAGFIHMIRDGRDTVASLYDAAQRFPEAWEAGSIDGCVRRWNRAARATLARAGRPGHTVVFYEDCVRAPRETLAALCGFMGLEFDPRMLEYREAARALAGSRPWKARNLQPLQHTRLQTFARTFDAEQQRYIEGRLLAGGNARALLSPAGGGI